MTSPRSGGDELPALPTSKRGLSELDRRILEVENRLIAREESLYRSVSTQYLRLKEEPKRLWSPVLGALSAVAGWIWLSRSRPRKLGVLSASTTVHRGKLVRYIGLAWPMLPVRWRGRISPTAAITLMGLAAPLLEKVVRGRSVMPPLVPVAGVDLNRFAGHWWEVARLSDQRAARGLLSVSYRQLPTPQGRLPRIEVVQGFADAPERSRQLRGIALATRGGGGARMKVSFWPTLLRWLPMAWNDHWIVYLDDGYSEALVGCPTRRSLIVLSRDRHLAPDRMRALLWQAQLQGFDTDRVVYPQT